MEKSAIKNNDLMEKLFKVGAHFGYTKSRRHPSAKPFIFGTKNRIEIFDLVKTGPLLDAAKKFIKSLAEKGGQILLVGGKSEARAAVKNAAMSLSMPFVAGRWLGGTLTNFVQIRKRVEKMEKLLDQKEKGELAKYTKKERLLIDREIEDLRALFSGLSLMKELPKALFVIDPKRELTAVSEAIARKIPVVALAGSDCDISKIDYPIPGNDSSIGSIQFFVSEIATAYKEGKAVAGEKK